MYSGIVSSGRGRVSLFEDTGDDETAKKDNSATKNMLSVCVVWKIALYNLVSRVTE